MSTSISAASGRSARTVYQRISGRCASGICATAVRTFTLSAFGRTSSAPGRAGKISAKYSSGPLGMNSPNSGARKVIRRTGSVRVRTAVTVIGNWSQSSR
jgi:hypothetical protein